MKPITMNSCLELLDRRVNASPMALAQGCTASLGPTGTVQPRDEDIDD
jgi:hypothetical protein